MRKVFFTAIIIFIAVLITPKINAYAARSELTVKYTASENSIDLEWSVSGKASVEKSSVYRYDAEAKEFVRIVRTDKTQYSDKISLKFTESVKYKIYATLSNGEKLSKTILCYGELPSIPYIDDDYICKAYIYSGEEKNNGKYPVIYRNYFEKKVIGETWHKVYDCSDSGDGKTVFYSVDDEIYRYSYDTGKNELILKNEGDDIRVAASPNGEYCAFRYEYEHSPKMKLWHNGKIYTVDLEEKDKECYFKAIYDDGRIIYTARGDHNYMYDHYCRLCEFDPASGKNVCMAVQYYDSSFNLNTMLFPEYDTYVMYYGGRSGAIDVQYGKIGEESKTIELPKFYGGILRTNGKIVIFCDENHVYSLDLESGKKSVITSSVKKKDEPDENIHFNQYVKVNADLSAVVYIDYENDRIVRLSQWDDHLCEFTKKQEIYFEWQEYQYLWKASLDLDMVYLDGCESHMENVVFFRTGEIIASESIADRIDLSKGDYELTLCRDRAKGSYEHKYKDLMILNPDGSKTMVFEGGFDSISNGGFAMINKNIYSYDKKTGSRYKSAKDVYFIDETGKAVLWDHIDYPEPEDKNKAVEGDDDDYYYGDCYYYDDYDYE